MKKAECIGGGEKKKGVRGGIKSRLQRKRNIPRNVSCEQYIAKGEID